MNVKLTPIDIQQSKFGLAFRGYSRQEVDALLDKVASAMEMQLGETQTMREQAAALEVQLLELRKKESALNNTLIAAQQVVEEMKRNAQKEVELRLKEAELQAERLMQDAWAQLRQVTQELEEARREKQLFLERWRSSLKTIEQALTMAGEGDTAPGGPASLNRAGERTGERTGGHRT